MHERNVQLSCCYANKMLIAIFFMIRLHFVLCQLNSWVYFSNNKIAETDVYFNQLKVVLHFWNIKRNSFIFMAIRKNRLQYSYNNALCSPFSIDLIEWIDERQLTRLINRDRQESLRLDRLEQWKKCCRGLLCWDLVWMYNVTIAHYSFT